MINVKLEDGVLSFSEIFEIKDGVASHKFAPKVSAYLKTLENGKYELSIQELELAKTHDQLALIHVYIKIFSDDGGYTPMQAKLASKEICGYYEVVKNVIRGGNTIKYKSFADASLKELTRIIDEFYTYLTVDCGLNVPNSTEWKEMTAEQKREWSYR